MKKLSNDLLEVPPEPRHRAHPDSQRLERRRPFSDCTTIRTLVFGLGSSLIATASALAATAPTSDQRLQAAHQFTRGKELVESAAFEEARQAYLAAIELDDDPYIRLEMAQLLVDLANSASTRDVRFSRLGEAASHAGVARDVAPNNPDILRLYGQINLGLAEVESSAVQRAEEAYVVLRELVEGDVQGLVSLAQIYLWKRQFSQAVDVLREASSFRADHPVIRRMLLEALLGSNALDEAEPLLSELLEAEPRALDQRMKLAQVYNRRGEVARALAVLEAAPPDLLQEPRLRDAVAATLHRAGEHERAHDALSRLIAELGPTEDRLRLRVSILNALARYGEAIDAIDEWRPDAAEDAVERVLLRSRLLERVGRAEEAVESLRAQIARAAPGTRMRLEFELGEVLQREGKTGEAIDGLRTFSDATRGGSRVMTVRVLADMLHRADRTDEAIALLDTTIAGLAKQPAKTRLVLRKLALLTDAKAWSTLMALGPSLLETAEPEVRFATRISYSEALSHLGRLDDALEVLQTQNVDPEATEETRRQALGRSIALRLRHGREGEARRQLDEIAASEAVEDLFFAAQLWRQVDRFDEMVPYLEAILEQEPESSQALFALATALERTGKIEDATVSFRRLLEIVPDHAPSLNYLGYMMAERGESLIEALTMTRRAVSIDPDNGAYVDSLGWVYFRLGKLDQARRYLEWAARLIGDDPTIHEHLGDVFSAQAQGDKARESYDRALALDSEDADRVKRKLQALDP